MEPTGTGRALERNLRIYSALLPASRLMFWAPIFFLFLNARFSIEHVLLLEAIYYGAVVIMEVPSGYLSDRFGRVVTLRLAMLSLTLSYGLFLTGEGNDFLHFAAAQVALAFGWAALSGTDTAFHHDSLVALDRAEEYAPREERLARNVQLAGAVSGILGGAAAVLDLRAAYALSLVAAAISLGLAFGLREPPRPDEGWTQRRLDQQLFDCARLMRQPVLAWLFAYVILMIAAEHVPYEFAQPYLAAVLDEPTEAVRRTPLAAGLLIAGFKLVSALAATRTLWLRARVGLAGALLGLMLLQCLVIGAMASTVHPLVLA
ncbi:MAG TPA: hypothetical protein VM285_15920, partial [Polyangia bacterium]|nr:hypothetical protein [Polyangia bacterium]